jgi:hypothetical protein
VSKDVDLNDHKKYSERLMSVWKNICSEDADIDQELAISELEDGWDLYFSSLLIEAQHKRIAELIKDADKSIWHHPEWGATTLPPSTWAEIKKSQKPS